MGEIGNTFSGLSGKTKEDFGHGQASFVTYLNVFNNSIGQPNMIEKVEIDPKQFQVKQGDILFTTSSETPDEVGMACVWPVNLPNLYLNSFCFGFRPKKEIDINFYAHMLRSPQVRNQITLLAQGISRYNISKTKMMDIRIWLPSESEQRRIGRFLGNIDNLITLHQRKSVTIKKLKSGLLRKMILTVESTLTDVFLPLFTIDWEQRKLGNLFFQTNETVNPKTSNLSLWSLTVESGLTPKPERYDRSAITKKEDQYKMVHPGEIVFNPMNMTIGAIGMNKNSFPIAVSGYYITMKESSSNNKTIDPCFFSEWMCSPNALKLYKNVATGSLIEKQRVQFSTFSKIRAMFPKYEEQKKIGQVFDALDDLITLHQRKLFIISYIK